MNSMSRRLALDSSALVRPRFRFGEPSTLRCSTSSCSPRCGSSRWRCTATDSGTCSSRARLPSPLTRWTTSESVIASCKPEHPAQAREALSMPASRTVESAPVGGSHGFSGLMRLIPSSEQRASSSGTGWSVATLTANLRASAGRLRIKSRSAPPIAAKLPFATTSPVAARPRSPLLVISDPSPALV